MAIESGAGRGRSTHSRAVIQCGANAHPESEQKRAGATRCRKDASHYFSCWVSEDAVNERVLLWQVLNCELGLRYWAWARGARAYALVEAERLPLLPLRCL